MQVIIALSRYALPFLGVVILVKCLAALLLGRPQEKTYGCLVDQADGTRYMLNMWETSIGRSKNCDIVIGYATVSRFHAVISRRIDGWYIFDLQSKSGTLVNGGPIENKQTIQNGDLLSMGNMEFRFFVTDDPVIYVGKRNKRNQDAPLPLEQSPMKPKAPIAPIEPGPQTGQPLFTPLDNYDENHRPQLHFQKKPPQADPARKQPQEMTPLFSFSNGAAQTAQALLTNKRTKERFVLSGNRVSIGRSRACDIQVDSPTASRRHAMLVLYEDGWAISDAGSTHGTYLNGSRVTSPQLLFSGDKVKIGEDLLLFEQEKRARYR